MKFNLLQGETKGKKLLQLFTGTLMFFATIFLFFNVANVLTYFIVGKTTDQLSVNPAFNFFYQRLTVGILIIDFLIINRLEKKPFPLLNFSLKDFGLMCLLGGIVIGLPELLYALLFSEANEYVINPSYNFSLMPFHIIAIFFPVVAEELIFRYFLIDKLKAFSRNEFFLIGTSALIFVFAHIGNTNFQLISTLFTGIVYSYAYLKFNSITIPIGLHFIHNIITKIIFGYDLNSLTINSNTTNEYIILSLLGLKSIILIFALEIFYKRKLVNLKSEINLPKKEFS